MRLACRYSNKVFTTAGCRIYIVDLPTLGITGSEAWTGTKRSLFFVPAAPPVAGNAVTIDWVRLVENQPSLNRTITWTGTGPVDIYLDNDNTATNDPAQTLGLLASSVNGTSYTLNVGALQPGTTRSPFDAPGRPATSPIRPAPIRSTRRPRSS